MDFIKPTLDDLPVIMEIIQDAQSYLKENNVDQWQNGFPSENDITADLKYRHSFLIYHEKKPVGFIVLSTDDEEVYNHPVEGFMKLKGPYTTIHRTAVCKSFRGNGISKEMFNFAKDFALKKNMHILRIDTHKDNKIMRHIISREGFLYCEEVQLPPENELRMRRLVFEKVI